MSNFALGGLIAGFGFALIDNFILLPLLERPARAQLELLEGQERALAERRLRLLRLGFSAQFVIFPVFGYIVGSMIGAGT